MEQRRPRTHGAVSGATVSDDAPLDAWAVAARVCDPELPMVTLADLGILREVTLGDAGAVTVTLTPTYSGCPAMAEIGYDVKRALHRAGYPEVTVTTRLSPPWSSDWISTEGRRKLHAAGVAPPHAARTVGGPIPITLSLHRPDVTCPHCGSPDTTQTAAFSATACRALYRCRACAEPFEYLKEI